MSTASVRLAAIALCVAAICPALLAAAPKSAEPESAPLPVVPGEKWNISTNVSMPGMSMPPGMKMPAGMAMPGGMGMPSQAMVVCQAKGTSATQAAEQQKNCTITNKRMVAGKQTAHMSCTMEGHTMEGDVEMESLGPDHYRTTMHMKTDQGAMDMVSEGQKVGGDCDANELKRKGEAFVAQAKKSQAQADTYMAGQCHDSATQMRLDIFKIKDSPCKDPADKALLCSSAQGYDNFGDLLAGERIGDGTADPSNPYAQDAAHRLKDIGAFCGFQPETVHAALCNSAEKDNKLVFLAENCPALAGPLGKAQCAGAMQFTGGPPVAAKYVSFCRAWVNTDTGRAAADSARAAGGKPQAPPKEQSQSDKAKEAIEKGKAKLKGLFGG